MAGVIFATESTVFIPATGAWVQIDDGLSGRPPALANRCRFKVVNNGVDRIMLFRGSSTAGIVLADCEPVEADKGSIEDAVAPNIKLFMQSVGPSASVRFIQYY